MNPAHPRSDPADIAHHDEQDMIMTIDIALPTKITQEHAAALGQYFQSETRLNRTQWELVWDGVDILRQATITLKRERQTFARLYDDLIDKVYGDPFIEALYSETSPMLVLTKDIIRI